jgi:hypothetical protein
MVSSLRIKTSYTDISRLHAGKMANNNAHIKILDVRCAALTKGLMDVLHAGMNV